MKIRSLVAGASLLAAGTLHASSAITKEAVTHERIVAETAKANAFFDRVFDEGVDRSPAAQGYLGIKKDHDKWDDYSEANQLAELVHTVQDLAELKRTINFELLDEQAQMSYRLFVTQAEHSIEGWKWHNHGYVFNQMEDSPNSSLPAFLINYHPVDNVADARAYVTRLRSLPAALDQLIERARDQAAHGILPPKFVFPLMIESCHEIITGAPFDPKDKKSALLEDFEAKVGALKDADAATKADLLSGARAALTEGVKPAYERLIALFEAQEKAAKDDDGSWKLPEGQEYYNFRLRDQTTTALSADEIHQLGLREVARIHAEMAAIKDKTGFKGDLPAFLKFMRDDPQFTYPSTDAGRAAYMKRATEIIDAMRVRLPEFFGSSLQPTCGQ